MNIGTCASTPPMMAMQPAQNAIGWWKERFWLFMRMLLGEACYPSPKHCRRPQGGARCYNTKCATVT